MWKKLQQQPDISLFMEEVITNLIFLYKKTNQKKTKKQIIRRHINFFLNLESKYKYERNKKKTVIGWKFQMLTYLLDVTLLKYIYVICNLIYQFKKCLI